MSSSKMRRDTILLQRFAKEENSSMKLLPEENSQKKMLLSWWNKFFHVSIIVTNNILSTETWSQRIFYWNKTKISIKLKSLILELPSFLTPQRSLMRNSELLTTLPQRSSTRATMRNATSGLVELFFTSLYQESLLSMELVIKKSWRKSS